MIYDVSSDRKRDKLHDLLKQYGVPVQKSAFEGRLTFIERQRLVREASRYIDIETDRFVLYTISKDQEKNIITTGLSRPEIPEERYFLV
jgi:CRISPR-associated endonuclease Cas2